MNNIKEVIKSNLTPIMSLIVFSFISIISCSYNEYYFFDLQEQFIHLAYSQSDCFKSTHIPLTNPFERFQLTNYPFKFTMPPPVARDLLNIKIMASPTTQICYNPYAQVYYTVDNSSLTLNITSKILKLETKPMKINPLNLQLNPMSVLIGVADGILEPLQSSDCQTKGANPNNPFNCSWNKTNLTITEKDQNLILGASMTNENGIIIISQTPQKSNNPQPAEIIKACDQKNFTKYNLPQDSVIEVDCK